MYRGTEVEPALRQLMTGILIFVVADQHVVESRPYPMPWWNVLVPRAEPERVGSATDTAVTVTVAGDGTVDGAE